MKTQIEIPEHLWKQLIEANQEMENMQAFIQRVIATGQSMLGQAQTKAQHAWREIAKTGVDLENYGWAPDKLKPVIHLVQINNPQKDA
jgi:hypothetical protein